MEIVDLNSESPAHFYMATPTNVYGKRVPNGQGGPASTKRLATLENNHPLDLNQLKCEICNKAFSRLSALKRHMDSSHGDAKRHACNVTGCEQRFNRMDTLKRHLAIHMKDGYTMCPGCGMSFRKDYFKDHILAKRNESCKIANDSFNRPTEFQNQAESDLIGLTNSVPVPNSLHRSRSMSRPNDTTESVIREERGYRAPSQSFERPTRAEEGSSKGDIAGSPYESYPQTLILDPVFFQLDEEEVAETKRLLARHSQEWDNLQTRIAHQSKSELSSVAQKVSLVIDGRIPYSKHSALTTEGKCMICKAQLERDEQALRKHVKRHLKSPPKPSHACDNCKIEFVYSQDLTTHQQHHGECQGLREDQQASWLTSAFKDKFVSDLRLWETAQLYAFLQSIIDTTQRIIPKRIKNLNSVPTLRRQSTSLAVKLGGRNLRSCSSNLLYNESLSTKELLSQLSMLSLAEEPEYKNPATSVGFVRPQHWDSLQNTTSDSALQSYSGYNQISDVSRETQGLLGRVHEDDAIVSEADVMTRTISVRNLLFRDLGEQLVTAIENGDISTFKSIMKRFDVAVQGGSGAEDLAKVSGLTVVLAAALRASEWKATEILLKYMGRNLQDTSMLSGTSEHLQSIQWGFVTAANHGLLFILEELLKAGLRMDVTLRSDGLSVGGAALLNAIEGEHDAVVALLLACGVSPDSPSPLDRATALMIAYRHGYNRIVRLLLGAGADKTRIDIASVRHKESAFAIAPIRPKQPTRTYSFHPARQQYFWQVLPLEAKVHH